MSSQNPPYLLHWLRGLCRLENIFAITGSLKRRILGRDFLEMRIDLDNYKNSSQEWGDLDIRGYSDDLKEECIKVLNSVGSLDLWNPSRFQTDILGTVDDPAQDIFLVFHEKSVIGISVLHKKSATNNLREIGFVAVNPKHREKKIGYKLLTQILAEARERQISQVFLKTDLFRDRAIKTYLNVGFVPYINSDPEKMRWRKIMEKLGIPE